MMAKPMKTLQMHYPMIQFFIMRFIIWPAPWADKMELSCPLGTTRRVPREIINLLMTMLFGSRWLDIGLLFWRVYGHRLRFSPSTRRKKNLATIQLYYMATIVRAFWLAAERALFSCKDRALWDFFPARRPFSVVSKTTSAWAKITEKMDKVLLYLQ